LLEVSAIALRTGLVKRCRRRVSSSLADVGDVDGAARRFVR
jgi:hypothetical protein